MKPGEYCFRVNGTHFFLGGGYSPPYKPKDVFADEFAGQDWFVPVEPKTAKAKTLTNAWIFDGHSWKGIKGMKQARQNFACSLAFFNEVVSFRFESTLSN